MTDPTAESVSEPAHSVLLERRAARVILLDPDGRLLLMRGTDPAAPERRFWFTVGGGLEGAESFAEGAVRELYEETGLVVGVGDLSGPVHEELAAFGFAQYWIEQAQRFFVAAAPHGWVPQPAALEEIEVQTVDRWSWWTLDQLRAHEAGRPHDGPGAPGEIVYPRDLLAVLARIQRL